MFNHILEISKQTSKGGRVPIKIALLKIHEDATETNKNGLHFKEEYVLNAIDSVKMMPICAEFLTEEKDVPYGHGLTGESKNENGIPEPEFLNSETVGVIESGAIETIKYDKKDIKVLTGTGYLYNQRYPKFVKWVRKNYALGTVDTSIEIMGLEENNNKIIYEEEKPTDEFRSPMEFVFTASAILGGGISPAEDSAIVLEVAQKNNNKEEHVKMEGNFDMNEVVSKVTSTIQNTITELNNKEESLTTKITELNEQITAKDAVIAEKDEKIVELNASVEQVQKALDDLKKEHETYWAERNALEKELGELKAKARIGELNSAIEQFSDEEKKYAEVEINSFNDDPMKGDINTVVNKIYQGIGEAAKKAAIEEEQARISEQNSLKQTVAVDDIFSGIDIDDTDDDEDINIF